MSEWLDLMLNEIDRRRAEEEEARAEYERRQQREHDKPERQSANGDQEK